MLIRLTAPRSGWASEDWIRFPALNLLKIQICAQRRTWLSYNYNANDNA